MCLILFAFQQHPDYPLILIANRDEYYARPTRDAHWWDEHDIYAGRDLEAGGTWLGANRRGRIAAVTNVREPGSMTPGKRSRGELTREFLTGETDAESYLRDLADRDQDYSGFNLLVGDPRSLWFYSNRDGPKRSVEPGVHGISNGRFDEPWPKLASGRDELEALLDMDPDNDALLRILTDGRIAADHELPHTGLPADVERMLSSRFIRSPEYGTRACSVLRCHRSGVIEFHEQNFVAAGQAGAHRSERIEIADTMID